jgi:hypothetical protein
MPSRGVIGLAALAGLGEPVELSSSGLLGLTVASVVSVDDLLGELRAALVDRAACWRLLGRRTATAANDDQAEDEGGQGASHVPAL